MTQTIVDQQAVDQPVGKRRDSNDATNAALPKQAMEYSPDELRHRSEQSVDQQSVDQQSVDQQSVDLESDGKRRDASMRGKEARMDYSPDELRHRSEYALASETIRHALSLAVKAALEHQNAVGVEGDADANASNAPSLQAAKMKSYRCSCVECDTRLQFKLESQPSVTTIVYMLKVQIPESAGATGRPF